MTSFYIPLKPLRTADEFGAVIDELENDKRYNIRIIASNETAVSLPSEPIEVMPHPTPTPQAPGAPKLLSVTPKPNGCDFEFEESTIGNKPFQDFVKATPLTGGGDPIIAPCDEVSVMGSYFGTIAGLTPFKSYKIEVFCKNDFGTSDLSNSMQVIPTDAAPKPEKITSKTGRSWDKNGYRYLYWADAGDFSITANVDTPIDLYLVGGGGGGHGQLVPIGMGGIGGGGSIVEVKDYLVQNGTTYTGTVGAGGIGGDTKNGGDSKFMDKVATGGGTSLGKADGTPCTELTPVPDTFNQCAAFLWNTPMSLNVSGYTVWDKNKQPDGVVYGQGGGGTNGTVGIAKAGNGQAGIVVLRYIL